MRATQAELEAIQSRVMTLPDWASARAVSAYAARPDEIATDELLRALWERGVRVALPRVRASELQLHLVAADTQLTSSALGVREPEPGAPSLEVERIDLFLVPGLLFDRHGRRLGRGGGHFDRLLARARPEATRVGLCHASRVVDALPEDPWDARMNFVVTTAELIVAWRGRRG
jgi:5-formyltetrahydrofolate cyclo-ligase